MAKEAISNDINVVLENLNLINKEGKFKIAAVLLFGQRPSFFVTSPVFRIGRFGKDDTDLICQDEIDGDLIRMADRVMETLKSKYLISPIHYEGLQRVEELEIPEEALREAIFNAIIHKDYTGSHIQMKVWDDRIELWNEGALPYDMTIEKLMDTHSSKPRNKNIASVFYKAGFIESWGRGILKIKGGFEKAGFKSPTFEEHCGGLLVTLYRTKVDEKTGEKTREKTREKILALINENKYITQKELMEKLGLSHGGVEYQLKILKNNGIIERIGGD